MDTQFDDDMQSECINQLSLDIYEMQQKRNYLMKWQPQNLQLPQDMAQGELDENSSIAKNATQLKRYDPHTKKDRIATVDVNYYNLDVIISVIMKNV